MLEGGSDEATLGGEMAPLKKPLSKARRAALKALHLRRRGKRQNDPGVSPRRLTALLSDISLLIEEAPDPGRISRYAVARYCGVSLRQVGRWLAGIHWPKAQSVRRMERWVRHVQG